MTVEPSSETTWLAEDDVEVTARRGVFFKEGTVAVSVYDANGVGATAYLTPAQASELAEEVSALALLGPR